MAKAKKPATKERVASDDRGAIGRKSRVPVPKKADKGGTPGSRRTNLLPTTTRRTGSFSSIDVSDRATRKGRLLDGKNRAVRATKAKPNAPHTQAQFVVEAFKHAREQLGYKDAKLVDSIAYEKHWLILLEVPDFSPKAKLFQFAIVIDEGLNILHDDMLASQFFQRKAGVKR